MRRVLLLFAIGAMALAADLPVKQVVLYKHGVGYFERAGKLGPGESARLDFDASEMNDVLKSLTVEEQGGGKISGLRYDSLDPLSHKLAEFPFQIEGGQPLALMLDQLKGARLEVRFGAETVAGLIVAGRLVQGTDKQAEREQLSLLLDSGDLRTYDLGAANGMRFADAKLQQQFQEYLAAVAASRSKDKRSVYIDSTGSAARDIRASYMIPSAVWKSSYRLIMGAAQPTLEGWAIVDNTTTEDWANIGLALVSGRPISFISQLYAPKYVTRQSAELADDTAARPVVHEGGYDSVAEVRAGAGGGGGIGSGMASGTYGGMMMNGGGTARTMASPNATMKGRDASGVLGSIPGVSFGGPIPAAIPSTIVANASAQEMGELFEYRIAQPVTIKKGESAMLPFLQQQIEGRKLLIYSDHSSQHPTNAAELTNTSGKTLDGGPITVYDGGYAGEALMETLKAGEKRLISYAVDLGTRITEAFGSKAAVTRELHADHGILTSKMSAEETRTYTIRNVDQKAKTLILEHPLRPQYTLLNQKPAEKTPSAYRFEIKLAADSTQEFAVAEERIYDQNTVVTSLTPQMILVYIQNRALSDAGRRQLQRIADQKTQIADNDAALGDARNQINDLTNDEQRIRNNIQSLNSVSGQQQQVQNYARQLDEHERQLVALRDRQAELQKKKTALDSELNKLIEALTF